MDFFVTQNKKALEFMRKKKDRTMMNLKISNLKSLNTESKLDG